MGKIDCQPTFATRTKQCLAVLLLAIPMIGHALGMLGVANAFVGRLLSNVILNLLPALGFFLLWRIAANRATHIAAKIATILYALWSIYFALLELTAFDSMPQWLIHIVSGAQILSPLILAYTISLVAKNNRLSPITIAAVWIFCAMCIVESYWSVANSALSLWIFDGMQASDISVSAFKEVYRWFVIALNILSAFSLIPICTSCAFDNNHNPNEPDARFTPINRYMVTTIIITLTLIAVS